MTKVLVSSIATSCCVSLTVAVIIATCTAHSKAEVISRDYSAICAAHLTCSCNAAYHGTPNVMSAMRD